MRRDGNVVHISEADVIRFNREYPGSRVQYRSHTIEFDARGNLVDHDFHPCEEGLAINALIDEAQRCG